MRDLSAAWSHTGGLPSQRGEEEPHASEVTDILRCHILDMLPDVIADGLKGRKLGAQKVLKDGIPVSDVGTSYAVKLHAVGMYSV